MFHSERFQEHYERTRRAHYRGLLFASPMCAAGADSERRNCWMSLPAGGGRLASAKVSRGRQAKKAEPGRTPSLGRAVRQTRVGQLLDRQVRRAGLPLSCPDSTVQEIVGSAASDIERSIKLPSIRNELPSGRRPGKYESNGRRWSALVDPIRARLELGKWPHRRHPRIRNRTRARAWIRAVD